MAEHRVSMLSASLRRYEDPAHSADPRIRHLVAQLAALEPAPAPRAHFRAELRAQLVAVTPRLVAEGPAIEARHLNKAPAASAGAHNPVATGLHAAFTRLRKLSVARPLGVVTAVIAVFAVLLGGAVIMSKKALPGDTLYSLKRANENVQLSFATGDTAKGRDYLHFAQNRVDEVSALLSRSSAAADGGGPGAAGALNARTAHLILTTLNSADSDIRNGSQLLGGQAVRNGSAAPLAILTAWAPGQVKRLQNIISRLGAGALHDRAAASTELTTSAFSRAKALHSVLGCHCLDKVVTDDLGPVPCTDCATPRAPGQPTGPATGAASTPPPAGTTQPNPKATDGSASGTTSTGPPDTATGSDPGTDAGTSGAPPSLPVQLPSLPVQLPTDSTTPPDGQSTDETCTLSLLGVCITL